MNKEDALIWLNHRLEVEKSTGLVNHFDINDITFFMTFIYHKTGKRVSVEQVKNSIINHSNSFIIWMEKLTNYLILTYDIDVVVDQKNHQQLTFNNGIKYRKIINYK